MTSSGTIACDLLHERVVRVGAGGQAAGESIGHHHGRTAMPQSTDESEIRTLVDNWAKAVRAKDMGSVLAHHTDDILMFDAPMPLQSQGMDEYRKTWELFFANSPGGPGSFDVTDMQITADKTVAYCHAILRIFDSEARLTIGMRKENQGWTIAHEHHSYPLELE